MFTVVGIAFAWGSTNYNVGNGARMGPGYFPLMLGILLTVLGLATMFYSTVVETEDGDMIGSIAWKPLGFIIGANVIFGILLGGIPKFGIPAMGLIAAIIALVFVSSLAGDRFKVKEVTILAVILAAFSYIAFVWLLKLQFPVWPTFIAG